MSDDNGGPWGGGGSGGNNGKNNGNKNGGNNRQPDGPQIPEIDELMRKGQERLRVLMGGKGGGGNASGEGGGGLPRGTFLFGGLAAVALWLFASFYTVKPEEQSVELFLGEFNQIGTNGLNFAPWPVVTYEKFNVTTNRTESLGINGSRDSGLGLMLTTDENIVDIDFQVVWNIKNSRDFLFSLKAPEASIRAISEAAMREVIAQSELAPILNRDRALIEANVRELIQKTLDQRQTGISVLRVNFNKVDPPSQQVIVTSVDGTSQKRVSVIDAFRDVQAAEQERDQRERQADAYANQRLAEARGQSAQIVQAAEGYRATVVNAALGEASRFSAVLAEYQVAPEVTRRRLYIETLEKVLGNVDKIIMESGEGGQDVVPYLSLNELNRNAQRGSN
ncbi:FtsH protease activity modulator HflK [Planktomarina sp.]|nr:FtsH protease activity modulator HflK [Planktomarina sp.]